MRLFSGHFGKIIGQHAQLRYELVSHKKLQQRSVGRAVVAIGITNQHRLAHHVVVPVIQGLVFLHNIRK